MLRQRSEEVVVENQILYEKLKENLVSNAINGKEMKEPPLPSKTQVYTIKNVVNISNIFNFELMANVKNLCNIHTCTRMLY